jgi:allantoin racemase
MADIEIAILMPVKETSIVTDYDAIEEARSPGTVFKIYGLEQGPDSIESAYDEDLAVPGVLSKVVELEERGLDAIVIYCAAEPGLSAARELARIPVIGPMTATLAAASQVGDRFCVVSMMEKAVPLIRRVVVRCGFERWLASVRHIEMPVLDIEENRPQLREELVSVARRAVSEDQADLIVLACTGLVGMAKDIQREVGVPVLDPGIISLKTAEMFVRMGLAHSKIAYPRPTPKNK